MAKLIILQTAVPDYRKKVFYFIKQRLKSNFILLCGDSYFEDSIKTDKSINFISRINNHYFFNKTILFQLGMWPYVLKKNTMILELNPRIISNWIILILRRIFNRKTILWGHAWPRKGKKSKSDIVRNFMRTFANIIIVYTKTQERELRKKMPGKTIISAPNAILNSYEMKTSLNRDTIKNIIYVGRLTENKKALSLVKTFYNIFDKLPAESKLIIVGEGEEKDNIEMFVKKNNLKDRVLLKGHISDYELLRELYDSSLISISPGYVGLSITQSFGFGVPMLISKYENHSPEIEVAKNNSNALFFDGKGDNNLDNVLLEVFENKEYWIAQREKICELCKKNYSVEVMAQTFINTIK